MNIKRCANCGKPSRADAEYCKGCGYNFSVQKPPRASAKISTPPASPHRAGHYSGLHPEDQPYQSTFMAVLRPHIPPALLPSLSPSSPSSNPNATWVPKAERQAADRVEQEEPDEYILPTSPLPLPSPQPSPSSSNPNATWVPKANRQALARQEQGQVILPRIATTSVTSPPERVPAPIAIPEYRRGSAGPSWPSDPDLQVLPSFVPRKPSTRGRVVPILLTISCLLFLVATSLLAFLFLSNRHGSVTKLTAVPNLLRANDIFMLTGTGFGTNDPITFSRDKNNIAILDGSQKPLQARTDETGAFGVQIMVSSSWGLGQHTIHVTDEAQQLVANTEITIQPSPAAPPKLQLQLSNLSIDFGAGDQGVVSRRSITLTNAGGGEITWQASSDQNWLTVTPNKGTFSGRAVAELMVNRRALPSQAYTGHVTFTQLGSTAPPLTLSVTMSIKATPASLVLSTASLAYTGSAAQNPPAQVITLQNNGGLPLDWSTTVITGNGAPWLSITPSGGHLGANAGTQVAISVQLLQLAVGSYQGTISFQGGTNPQVTVTLNVVAPANLTVSPTSLNLQAAQGQKSDGQITMQDSGGQSLDWAVSTTTADGANWLSVSPASGHLDPGAMKNITVTANAGTLAVNPYQGTLTFTYGTSTKRVTVALGVSLPPMPGISVQPSTLDFNTPQGINPPAQSFTITNIGNAPLNWAITKDANGTTYAATSLSKSTSSLAPAKSVTITVTPNVANAGPGSISALITVFDSDKGSTVPQQQIAVMIIISSAAIINASPNNMTFDHSSTITNSQELLYINNAGSAPLNWSLVQGSQPPVPWLSVDLTSGTVAPGTTITVGVTCDSSQLPPGTYTATLVLSDTDPNSPVLSQTITVTLTVSS